jgi:hypothetical protein
MAIVTLVAVNCAAVCALLRGTNGAPALLILGLMPIIDLLLPAMILSSRQIRRHGKCHAFLAGFVTFGCAAVVVFTALSARAASHDVLEDYLLLIERPLIEFAASLRIVSDSDPLLQSILYRCISCVVLSLPLFSAAVFGGWLAWAGGVTLAQSGSLRLNTAQVPTPLNE